MAILWIINYVRKIRQSVVKAEPFIMTMKPGYILGHVQEKCWLDGDIRAEKFIQQASG